LVERHHSDSALLLQGDLDINPIVKGQEYGVREGLLPVVLGEHVDPEGGLRVVPDRKRFVNLDQVVLRAAADRIRRERVLAEVLHPESHRVADVAPFELKLWNIKSDEGVARTFVELGNLVILLGDGVAERSCDALRHEGR